MATMTNEAEVLFCNEDNHVVVIEDNALSKSMTNLSTKIVVNELLARINCAPNSLQRDKCRMSLKTSSKMLVASCITIKFPLF